MMEKLLKHARTLLDKNAYDEALNVLLPLFEEREMDGELYFLLGQCFMKKRDYSNAVRFFQKASELQPQEMPFLFALANAYEAFEEPIKAMDTYLKILAITPDSVEASERLVMLIRSLDEG